MSHSDRSSQQSIAGNDDDRPILVLGATGGVGGAVALELIRRGRPVRLLMRDPAKAARRFDGAVNLAVVAGDALDADALRGAARGVAAIFHGVNYPYHRWRPNMTRVTDNVVAAASAAGSAPARVVFPGNVYGLGRQTGTPLAEDTPDRPCSSKGALRVELEDKLRRAAAAGVPVLNVRAGDYFGPTVRNGLVDRLFGNAAAGKRPRFLGRRDIPHQFAYMPDLARATVDLMLRPDAPDGFDLVHFPGHVVASLDEFGTAIARAAGRPGLRPAPVPWPLVRLAGLFDPATREVLELRYLFDESLIIDGGRLGARLPEFRPTPLDQAIRATLESYRADA